MTNASDQISKLHALFCERTKLETRLVFAEVLRKDLLQSYYKWDAAQCEADLLLIIRYLQIMIADGKRNIGAFKLRNFLQPDQWDADLAEARLKVKRLKATPSDAGTRSVVSQSAPAPEHDPKISEALAKFRKEQRP